VAKTDLFKRIQIKERIQDAFSSLPVVDRNIINELYPNWPDSFTKFTKSSKLNDIELMQLLQLTKKTIKKQVINRPIHFVVHVYYYTTNWYSYPVYFIPMNA
jgi:hypothetical protein